LATIIRDAHGRYAFSDDKHSGSLALSFEQIIDKAGDTDVWAFKVSGDRLMSKDDLLEEFHGYSALKAFRSGDIYECLSSKVPYFEEVSFRPDYLLREMIQLLHPGVDLGGLRYYQKLALSSKY
jgi:iron complex transport system substrate-binding protein